jgi:hypothetical protein
MTALPEQPLSDFVHDLLAESAPRTASERADAFWNGIANRQGGEQNDQPAEPQHPEPLVEAVANAIRDVDPSPYVGRHADLCDIAEYHREQAHAAIQAYEQATREQEVTAADDKPEGSTSTKPDDRAAGGDER